MKSIALTKLSLAAPAKLRDLVMDPSGRTGAPCCRLVPSGPKGSRRQTRTATDRLLRGLSQLAAALPLTELLCVTDGNQDEENAQPWLAGLPTRHDRTRSLLGRLLKQLKEAPAFDGLIRLHQADIPVWLPVLARRPLKYGLPATLCMSREPVVLIAIEPAGEICCYSTNESVLEHIAELAPTIGLEAAGEPKRSETHSKRSETPP